MVTRFHFATWMPKKTPGNKTRKPRKPSLKTKLVKDLRKEVKEARRKLREKERDLKSLQGRRKG